MDANSFSEYWAQVEYCNFKAGLVTLPASKQLWIQLAQDWATLAQSLQLPASDQSLLPPLEELEHSLAA